MAHGGKYEARIYRPKHRQQKLRYNGALIGCTDTSFAMGVDAVTFGGCLVNEAIVRGLSNEAHPDPNSPGLNQSQLVAVADKLHIEYEKRTGDSAANVRTYLDQNRRLVIQGMFPNSAGNPIPHAMLAQAVRDGQEDRNGHPISGWAILVNDPLRTVEEWRDIDTVLAQMKALSVREHLARGLFYGIFNKVLPYVAAGAS